MQLATSRTGAPLALALTLALAPAHAWAQAPAPGRPASPAAAPPAAAPPAAAPPAAAPPGAAPPAGPAAPAPKADAAAKPPAPPVKPEEVAKLLADAQKAMKAGKWEDARVILERVEKVKPSFKLSLDLARAEIGADKSRDAAVRLIIALADATPDAPEADRKAAEGQLALAKTKIGEVRFKVKPNGAEVTVDGQSVGTSPIEAPIFVDPGSIEVAAKAEGYTGIRATRTVAAGSVETIELNLNRSGKLEAPAGSSSAGRPPSDVFRGVNMPILISGAAASLAFVILGSSFAILSDLKSSSSHALEQPGAPCGSTCASQFNDLQQAKVNFAGGALWSYIGASALLLGSGAYWTTMYLTTPKQLKANVVAAPDRVGASFSYQW